MASINSLEHGKFVNHDAVDSGAPFKIGGYAADPTTLPTAVSSGDRVNGCFSTNGEQLIYNSRLHAGEDQTNVGQAIFSKPTASANYVTSVYRSTALAASASVKGITGTVYYCGGRLDSTAPTGTYYILMMNSASLPADGAITTLMHPIKIAHTTGTNDYWEFPELKPYGITASSGIQICLSTTEFTKTISGAYLSLTCLFV